MRERLTSFFDVSVYETLVEKNRARMVYGITVVMVVLYGLYVVFVPTGAGDRETYLQKLSSDWQVQFYVLSFYFVAGLTFFFTRNGHVDWAGWGAPLMWVFGALINTVATGAVGVGGGASFFALIALAGLLQGRKGVLAGTLVASAGLLVGVLLRSGLAADVLPSYITSAADLAKNNGADFFTTELILIGGAILVYLFLRFARISRAEGAIQAVEDRQMTAEIMTHIAQEVARRVPLKNLLSEIVEQINQRFGFIYHTQIFLIDDAGQDARLVASTGAVGRKLLELQHSLAVGSVSVIGQVTSRGQYIIARSGSQDSVHRRNELLPDTAVEAAFPLRIGERIIGALDMQSREANAFSDINLLATFQALADSTTLAIDNVSQFQKAEERLQENEQLIAETREALHEVERLNERLTGRAWSEFLRGTQDEFALAADVEAATTTVDATWTDALKEALYDNHLVQKQKDGQQLIAVPLRIRGRVVGAMEFELDETRTFTPEDFDLVQEVSTRFGMAIESARLMDESRRAAQREALVNQISARLQTTNDVTAMLGEAARSLREVLKADKVAIRLGKPPAAIQNPAGNGSDQ